MDPKHHDAGYTGEAAEARSAKDAPSTEAAPAPKAIEPLGDHATLKQVIAKVNELVARSSVKRDRGPESTRVMTKEDAEKLMLGDMRDVPHSKAAELLGLSYGQVYSARKGYTFKGVYKASDKRW